MQMVQWAGVSPGFSPVSFFLFLRFLLVVENEAAHRGRAFLGRRLLRHRDNTYIVVRIGPMPMKVFGLFGDWTVAGNLHDQHPC